MKKLIWIDASFFCCGVETKDGKIIEAAPIVKYSIGKSSEWLKDYLERRGILNKWVEMPIID